MRLKNVALKSYFFAILSLTLLLQPAKTAHAGVIDDIFSYVVRESLENIDIRRTMMDATTTMLVDVPTIIATGRNYDQLNSCFGKIIPGYPTGSESDSNSDDTCEDLRSVQAMSGVNTLTRQRSTGSLMGLATTVQGVVQSSESLPINLAYYAKYTAAKVPVLNQTALAANDVTPGFPLNLVLTVWETIRNISYGMLAIFMIAIGVMVMLRQKINPQTVVTVQAAIPRVIIAVILITFSYPIAALAIQLLWPLAAVAVGVLNLDALGSSATPSLQSILAQTPLSTNIFALVGIVINYLGAGLLSVVLSIIAGIVLLILVIKLLFQIIISFVRITYLTLSAPITFAWGAIPGNELATTNWFKSLVVNIITVPAMFFTLALAQVLQVELIGTVMASGGAGIIQQPGAFGEYINVVLGIQFMLIGVPCILIVLLLEAGKIPSKIEEAVLGREPYKKKK